MDDERSKTLPNATPGGASPASHEERVQAAFDDLGAKLGDRATPEARASVEQLREATLDKDAARLRAHLDDVKEKHGWLWEELTTHPRVTALVNELALMGL
jgi:signal transduction histidine kinase